MAAWKQIIQIQSHGGLKSHLSSTRMKIGGGTNTWEKIIWRCDHAFSNFCGLFVVTLEDTAESYLTSDSDFRLIYLPGVWERTLCMFFLFGAHTKIIFVLEELFFSKFSKRMFQPWLELKQKK